MKYIEYSFICHPNTEPLTDVLGALLSDIGFESFVPSTSGLLAYVPEGICSATEIDCLLLHFPLDAKIGYSSKTIEDKNWNEEWEKHYFQPLVIDDRCIIHSSFNQPEGQYEYRIVIDPKMAFGTGHHHTTRLLLKEILSMELQGRRILDMGCGTAVLSILASLRGAAEVTAVDIDEWAYQNAVENVKQNNIANIQVIQGDAGELGKECFDVIFANINRNVLLRDIPLYAQVLNPGGRLVMSGFFEMDVPEIRKRSSEFALPFIYEKIEEEWAAVVCEKQKLENGSFLLSP